MPNPAFKSEGDFSITSEGIVSLEKANAITFAGISLVDPAIFNEYKTKDHPFDLWKTIYQTYIMSSQVSGVELHDFWMDIGTIERLQEANNSIHD